MIRPTPPTPLPAATVAAATASYTFWAWSARSKQIRKIWEQSRQGQHQATARA